MYHFKCEYFIMRVELAWTHLLQKTSHSYWPTDLVPVQDGERGIATSGSSPRQHWTPWAPPRPKNTMIGLGCNKQHDMVEQSYCCNSRAELFSNKLFPWSLRLKLRLLCVWRSRSATFRKLIDFHIRESTAFNGNDFRSFKHTWFPMSKLWPHLFASCPCSFWVW